MNPRLSVSLRAASVRRGDKWVLRAVTWQIKPGERWALLGENGAGKTQLLKLLSGDIWPTPTRTRIAVRSYLAGRRTVELLDAKPRIAYIGGERQDKYVRYGWNLRAREVVATGLHRTDLLLSPVTRTQAGHVAGMLRACGIARLAARKFLSLSYGEKRLVLLARALVQQPDWLLLDEVYNGLDGVYRRRIDAVLAAARAAGQSWVATAHRATDVPSGTRFLLELSEGRIRQTKRFSAADHARLRARAAESWPRGSRHRKRRPSAEATHGRTLLRLTNVDLYVDYRLVLQKVNWQLRQGEHWALLGANGAGKSSFLKLLYGDLSPALGGSVERAGCPAGTPISAWKRRVGYVSPELQSDYALDVDLTQLVASGRHASIGLAAPMTPADVKSAAYWLTFFKLRGVASRRPRELSYGQLRRALIARAMAADPKILLLDEPLTGLDPVQRATMKRLLKHLMRRRVTLVIAIHHPEDLPLAVMRGLHLHKRLASVEDCYSAT